jgi:hypothetical protein
MVPPINNYTPNPTIHMPHIASQGLPPALDSSSFANWQFDAITYLLLFNGTLSNNQGGLEDVQPRQSHAKEGG